MNVVASGITDVGNKRGRNEDAFLINEELRLFVVADGMGGHAGGEFASAIAVNTVEEVLAAAELPLRGDAGDPVEVTRSALNHAVEEASRRVNGWAEEHPQYRGMGTTLVALLLHDGNAFIAHVGDSRLYRLRDGALEQVTDDHSLVAQCVREGSMTEEQAKVSKRRNVITRALGFKADVEVDVQVRGVVSGDRFVLCSDGLSGPVAAEAIAQCVTDHDPQSASRRLIAMACDNGGDDNITAVVLSVEDNG